MNKRASYILAFLFLSVLPLDVSAQNSTTQGQLIRLTLAQAISMADSHYPRIRAALAQQNAANADVAVARDAYLPRLDTLWQTNRATANNVYGLLLPQSTIPSISGPVLPADNGRSAWSGAGGVLASWQPFDFGVRGAQVDVARNSALAAGAAASLTRLDVEVGAANAYFDLATAGELAAIAQANVDRFQTFADSVHVLVNNELRPGADAAQADAQLAVARTQSIEAKASVEVRRAILANFIGVPPSSIELDDRSLKESAPEDLSSTTPITSHPAVRQEAALVSEQQSELSVLARSYAPQFNTEAALSGRGAGTALNGVFPGGTNGLAPDTLNWAVGVQVAFPVLDIFSLRDRKKVQEANLHSEQARYDQTLDDLSAEEQQAEAQFSGAREVAQNTPVELAAAKESEAQQRARFQAGLATVVDIAAAESVLAQAEGDDAVARLSTWRSLVGVAAARGDLAPFLSQLAQRP